MVKKYNRIKSQQHVRLYKVQLISVAYGSVLYSVAFEFAPTIYCTDDRRITVAQWQYARISC